ncbi:MAG: VCBS repeat-containing protein [Balneolaceae bacterium]|nr:VCBS repeat-containing protein [Balneolaceae bacterium]
MKQLLQIVSIILILGGVATAQTVTSISPFLNSDDVSNTSNVTINFSEAMDNATITSLNVIVSGSQRGVYSGSFSFGATSATFDPDSAFFAGEIINVVVTTGVQDSGGDPLTAPYRTTFTVAASGDGEFSVGESYTADGSNFTDWTITADINEDGYVDIITLVPSQNKLSVFTNDGDGTFSGPTNYTTANSFQVEAKDVNNDGAIDLVTSNNNANMMSVFINNGSGSGTFASKADYANGSSWNGKALTTGDINNDGYEDVLVDIIVGGTVDSVQVFLNDGDGTFTVNDGISTTDQFEQIKLWDIDGDEDLDLVGISSGLGQLVTYLNDGSGSFTLDGTHTATSSSYQFTLNNFVSSSSLIEALTVDQSDDQIRHLTDGFKAFVGSQSTIMVGDTPVAIASGDLDGDGHIDVVVSNALDTNLSILTNNGSASFTESNYSTGSTYANYISLADVDNDGDLDIVMGNQDGTVSISKNFSGPAVTSITPANGSTDIATNSNIVVAFNEAMKSSTLNSTNVTVVGSTAGTISGTYTYNSGDSTLTIDPTSDFILGDQITVTVSTNVTSDADVAITSSSVSIFDIEGVNVQSISPTANAYGVSANSDIDITFNDSMDNTTLTTSNILVFGSLSGKIAGSISISGNTATFNPTNDFLAGELITVIATTAIENSSNVAMDNPNVFQFTVDGASEFITQSDVELTAGTTPYDVDIADLNVDGNLDLITVNGNVDSVSIILSDGSGGFSTLSQLATGDLPTSVATGDFDNQNGVDFVVTNFTDGDIRVYLNNGSGTFTTTDYTAGSGAVDAVVADVNGDGYLDIIVHNRNAGNEQIFLNDGDGTFTSSGTVSTSTNMDRIFAADLDNDDDIDIISGGADMFLYIALNNGDGTFATATNTSINSRDAEFVDLNGDGYLDLVVSYDAGNEVSVHLNNGNGSFGAATDYTVSNAQDVAIFDYNNDGDMDILAVNFDGTGAQVLINGGSGTFSLGQTIDVGTWPENVMIADLNEDGQLDFVTANRGSNNLSVNYGVEFVEVTEVSPTVNSVGVAITDNITATFNDDINSSTLTSSTVLVHGSQRGKLTGTISYDSPSKTMTFDPDSSFRAGEIITVTITTGVENSTGSSLTYPKTYSFSAKAEGAGYFSYSGEFSVFPNYVSQLEGMDLDGDGDLDQVGTYNDKISIRFNDGSGTFGFGSTTEYNMPGGGASFQHADLDNDGDVDILVMRGNSKYLVFLENNGSGVFTRADSIVTNAVIPSGKWGIADYDNDGNVDVILVDANGANRAIYVYTNDGAMNFTQFYQSNDLTENANIDIADLNNDGYLDFVLSDRYESFDIMLNNGDGTLGSETSFSAPSGSTTRAIASDLDGDGYKDLIVSNPYATGGSSFTVYLNNGDGSFGSGTSTAIAFDGFWVETADMDGDSDLDVIVGRSNRVTIAYNDGSGGIGDPVVYTTNGSNIGAAIFDYDGDNDLDILNPNFPNVYYLTNETPATPSTAVTNLTLSNVFSSSLSASWTNGNGTGRLIVAKQGSAVDVTPTDDIFYTAGDFGSGSDLGSGNFVVYSGSSNTASISGLTPDSTYHFAVFEYNAGNSEIKYRTTSPATASTTTKLYPTTASTVSVDQDQGTILNLSWSGGDGANQLVAIREGAAITWTPEDSTTYTADSVFSSATDLGDGTKVVSNDNSGSVIVSGLSLSTTYYISVFEYNGNSGSERYLTSSIGTITETTQSFEGVEFDTTAGYAYRFDGGNSLDSFAELYTEGTVIIDDAFTTELWIKPDLQNQQQYILSWYEEQLVLGINSSNQLFGFHTQQGTGGSTVTVTGTTTVSTDEWYHVALTGESGGNLTLYVNGVAEATAAITDVSGDDDSDDYWYLGSEYAENNYFYGTVDELRIWSDVRSESEIRTFMHQPYRGLTTNLGGYWQFNEGTGDSNDELNDYSADFYDENGWVQSTAPLGNGTLNVATAVQTGTLSLGNVSLNMTNGFDNAVDVYAFEIESSSSIFENEEFYPSSYNSLFGDSRFIINVFGTPGTFSADMTLDFGSSTIPSGYDSTPDSLKLFTRNSGSESTWTSLGGADAVNSSAGTAIWNGITSFSQFAAVDTSNNAPASVTFTKANYADATQEANQDRIAYNIWLTRGDDQGIFNANRESSFNRGSNSPIGTLWSFGNTSDVESLTFEPWRDAVSSNPPGSVGKEMVLWLYEHDTYLDITFTSWTSNGNGGGFSYVRSEANISDPSPINFESTAGYALEFDGVDDYALFDNYFEPLDDRMEDMPDPVTFEMWVNPDTLTDGKMVLAASYGTQFQIGIDSTDNFYATFREGTVGAWRRATSTTSAVKDQWFHLAASLSSNDYVRLYINGVLEDSVAIAALTTGFDSYYLGKSRYLESGGYHFFDGMMDEFRIWQEVRSDSAIRAGMFTSNLDADRTEIYAYWQMNEGSGTTVDDLANFKDLTLEGPTWVTSGVPMGGGAPSSTTNFQSGSVTVGNASLSMADDFDNPVDIQVTEVTGSPNVYPAGFTSGLGGKYFVINLFGSPGTFNTSLTLTYGPGVLTSSNLSEYKLYKRGSNSTGAWTEVASAATSVNTSTGAVTWSGITAFSQFMGVLDEIEFDIQLSNGSDVVAYKDSTYIFGSSFFDLSGDFADSTLTISVSQNLSGNLFIDQNSNETYDSGTDLLVTASQSQTYIPSGSNKLGYEPAGYAWDTTTVKLELGEVADSVSLEFFTVEGNPTIAGNSGENGWYLLANPFTSTIGDLLDQVWTQGAVNSSAPSADVSIYTFVQDSAQYLAVTTDLDTTKLDAGEGLLVYLWEDDDLLDGQSDVDGGWPKTLQNYGNPFGVDISVPVKNVDYDGVSGTSGSEGFVLFGNPYGWPLAADSVIATLKRADELANSYVYRWNPTAKTYEIKSTGAIQPYESVFIRVIGSGTSSSLSFDFADADGSINIKKVAEEPFKLLLTQKEGDIESEMALRFDENGSTEIDPYDGYYLGSYASQFANLYTMVGDQGLSINNLPMNFAGEMEYPIYLHSTESGAFTLNWDREALPEQMNFTLVNQQTGEEIDLKKENSAAFTLGTKTKNSFKLPFNTVLAQSKAKQTIEPVFVLRVSGTAVSNEDDLGIPREVELYQNYPNPFNPSSVIRFGVPEQARVQLEVFDVLGRKVMTLVDGDMKQPGRYNISFNARDLASGMYVYRLVIGQKVLTKKMMLIK